MAKHLHPSSRRPKVTALRGVSPWTLGLLGAATVGGVLLVSRRASAADGKGLVTTPSPTPPAPQLPVNPASAPTGTPNEGLVPGQMATVIAPSGLFVRSSPSKASAPVGGGALPQGSVVLVLDASRSDGWVQVQVPDGVGFMCNTCVDAPGGPWLSAGAGADGSQAPTASNDGGSVIDFLRSLVSA